MPTIALTSLYERYSAYPMQRYYIYKYDFTPPRFYIYLINLYTYLLTWQLWKYCDKNQISSHKGNDFKKHDWCFAKSNLQQ